MRASLPTDGSACSPPQLPMLPPAVDTGVGIQNFLVPTLAGRSDSIGVSGNRCGIDREEKCRTRFPLRTKVKMLLCGIVQVDPFESGITVIVSLKKRARSCKYS